MRYRDNKIYLDERMNGRTNERDWTAENIMPWPTLSGGGITSTKRQTDRQTDKRLSVVRSDLRLYGSGRVGRDHLCTSWTDDALQRAGLLHDSLR